MCTPPFSEKPLQVYNNPWMSLTLILSHPKRVNEEFIFDFVFYPEHKINKTAYIYELDFPHYCNNKKNQVLMTPKRRCT